MASFTGSDADSARARLLDKKREEDRKNFEKERSKIQEESSKRLEDLSSKFAKNSTSLADKLAADTIGLVLAKDFRAKKQNIELQIAIQLENEAAAAAAKAESERELAKRPRPSGTKPSLLSFADDEEPAEEEEEEESAPKKRKFGKNPHVNTEFLPDRDREQADREEREKLALEWAAEQERIKKEVIEITYSFYDGSGHRRAVELTKGCSIADFLNKVRLEFHELRTTSVENMLYIKEDLIIPHHFTFYDLIVSKARGKSGPLFHFDVHDDVRLHHDATVEKDESHAGKVVERHWYDRNRHIFPASRWEVYDPSVERGAYTTHGGEVQAKKK